MSKLERLIQQYCPDGVEYVPLSSIGTIKRGNGLQKKDFVKAGIGCIHYGQIYTKFGLFTNKTLTYVDKELADHLLHIEKGDLVIACTSENVEDVCKAVAWLGDDSIVTGGHSCVLHHNQNPKYIAYFFQTESFQRQKRKYAYGTKVIDIKPDSIGKIEIPLPPLPVQEEIVRILDAFTELQAELQAELQKRKQQYNYYLDNLLNFKDINRGGYQAEVRWMKMSEVFETITDYTAAGSFKSIAENVKYLKSPDYAMLIRTTDLKSRFRKGDFIYVSKSAFDYLWRVKMDKECIVMPNVGNCGEIYYVHPNSLPYDNCALAPNAILVRSKLFNNKYLSYCLQVECFQKQLAKITSPVGQSKFNKTELKKLLVPIPSLADQQKIVDILDRFDTITTDLTQGLPAEIEKRRQQYEYYRDKLLTFKRKGA